MQATTTLLRLFFHGLIAFVDDRPPGMTSAYMLCGDKGMACEHGHKAIEHGHKTIISFKVRDKAQCPYRDEPWFGKTTCSIENTAGSLWCACYIRDRVDLEFGTDFAGAGKKFGGKPNSVRPFSEDRASDIAWLAQMAVVNGDDGKAKKYINIERKIRAHMEFKWQDAKSCHLDQVADDLGVGPYKVYPNRFVTDVSSTEGHVQSLAEHVMFELKFGASPERLVIKERGGSGKIVLRLNCSDGRCGDILIVNDISEEMCNEDALQGVGAHFLEYYELALNARKRFPMRLRENAVPLTVKGGIQLFTCESDPFVERYKIAQSRLQRVSGEESGKGVKSVFELLDEISTRGFQTRVICPMAVFEN